VSLEALALEDENENEDGGSDSGSSGGANNGAPDRWTRGQPFVPGGRGQPPQQARRKREVRVCIFLLRVEAF